MSHSASIVSSTSFSSCFLLEFSRMQTSGSSFLHLISLSESSFPAWVLLLLSYPKTGISLSVDASTLHTRVGCVTDLHLASIATMQDLPPYQCGVDTCWKWKFSWSWVRMIHSIKSGITVRVHLLFVVTVNRSLISKAQSDWFLNWLAFLFVLHALSLLLCIPLCAFGQSIGGIYVNTESAAFCRIFSISVLRYNVLTASGQTEVPYWKTDTAVLINRSLSSRFNIKLLRATTFPLISLPPSSYASRSFS